MSTILTEDFEGGTAGAAITKTNSGARAIFGTPVFASGGIEGALCGQFDGTAPADNLYYDAVSTTVSWTSFYFRVESLPTGNAYFFRLSGAGDAQICDARIQADGKVVVRDNITAAITSGVSVTAGEWHRASFRVTRNTQMELRLYLGANRHGSTPDWQGTGNSTRDLAVESAAFGTTATGPMVIKIDRIRVDNAVEPASMVPVSSQLATPVVTATPKNVTAVGATDGEITATWPAVTNAAAYESCLIPGLTGGDPPVATRTDATRTRTWTGLAAGDYRVFVRAI